KCRRSALFFVATFALDRSPHVSRAMFFVNRRPWGWFDGSVIGIGPAADRSAARGTRTMGFLKRFLKTNVRQGRGPSATSSFRDPNEDALEAHLGMARDGRFVLTEAVRPSYDLQVVPRAGYRFDSFVDDQAGVKIPVLMAAASREML